MGDQIELVRNGGNHRDSDVQRHHLRPQLSKQSTLGPGPHGEFFSKFFFGISENFFVLVDAEFNFLQLFQLQFLRKFMWKKLHVAKDC